MDAPMQIKPELMKTAATEASTLLKSLANETRLMILCQLVDGEKSVGELADLLDIPQSPLSQHLARLRRDGLVETRREAQSIYYRLAGENAPRVLQTLYELYCAPFCGPAVR
jgi:DNA-binding transcriptional ArsR family regulator